MEPTHIADGIWLVEGPIVSFYGFPYSTRMVVVRLAGERVWIWSPIALDAPLKAWLDGLGRVAFLVSPNKLHHLYLDAWQETYPDAALWAPSSVARKRRDLRIDGLLGDAPPAAWADEIDQAWFRGSLLLDEVAFFHRASRTAIFADLTENFSEDFLQRHWPGWQRAIARLWGIVEPWGYAPLEVRLSFVQRRRARQALAKALAWQPERVVMAHGRWQADNGRAYLERAFAWLERQPKRPA